MLLVETNSFEISVEEIADFEGLEGNGGCPAAPRWICDLSPSQVPNVNIIDGQQAIQGLHLSGT